jgi:hypothetical protein
MNSSKCEYVNIGVSGAACYVKLYQHHRKYQKASDAVDI